MASAAATPPLPSPQRGKKANGRPRRPRHSLASIVANLHVLLRAPSFSRWPLSLRFFDRDMHAAWLRWCATAKEGVRSSLRVETDFPPEDVVEKSGSTSAAASSPTKGRRKMGTAPAVVTVPDSEEEDDGLDSDADDHDHSDTDDADHLDNSDTPKWGIHALPLDHSPLRSYVAKARSMFEFERLGCCVSSSCGRQPLIPAAESGELIAICPNDGCEAAGHVACWSEELLREENAAARREGRPQEIVPIEGTCPSCGGNIRWVDMMKELTLRERGGKEVDRLLRKKRGIPAGSAA